MSNKLVTVMIVTLIGLMLLPVISAFTADLTGVGGALETSTAAPLVDFIPTLFVFGIITYDVVQLINTRRG